jgi:hypothetical protein
MAVGGLALAVRLFYRFAAAEPLLFAHPYNYFHGALRILENADPLGFIWTSDAWHQWLGPWTIAPLYYLFVAAVLALTGHLLPLQVLQFILDAGVAVAAAGLGRRIAGPRGVWAGVVYALNFHAIEQSASTLTENLHSPLLVGALAILAAEASTAAAPRWRRLAAGGFLLGMSGLARSVSTAFVPLAALWRASQARTRREAVQAAAVIALAAGAAILPWTARNVFVIGDLVPVESISVYNFWDDNAFVDGDRRRHQEGVIAGQPTLAAQRSQAMWFGWRGIVRNPGLFAEKAWRNLLHIVRLDGLHLLLAIEEPHPAWRHAALILLDDTVMLATIPLFLVFVAAGARSPTRSLILLWSGYYLLMVVGIFHNEIRYRSTLLPFALAGAAGGVAILADPAGRRRGAVRFAVLVGLISAAGMVSPFAMPAVRAVRAAWTLRALSPLLERGDIAGAEGVVFRAATEDRVAARPWLAFGSALARRDEPVRALDAYRRAEERKSYVWTPRLVRPQLLAEAGLPNAEALAEADAFSWQVDPWLALEIAWRALPAPRADEVRLGRGDYGAVRGFTLPRRDHRWSMRQGWIRLRPVTGAAAYVVSVEMGFPPPSTLPEAEVLISVDGGPSRRIHVGRAVQRYSFEAPAPATGTMEVRIESPTWNRLDEPAEQGVRVDRVSVAPVRAAPVAMVRSYECVLATRDSSLNASRRMDPRSAAEETLRCGKRR